MAYQFNSPTSVQGVKTLVGGNRLEARPRSREFNRSLRAEIRDPAWLLARQWQMKEFRAEDRGTPAYAEVTMDQLALQQIAFPGGADPVAYDPRLHPLEAAVEAQPIPLGPGLRLQLGHYWRQLMRTLALPAAELEAYQGLYARNFPLAAQSAAGSAVAYAQERTTAEAHELLQVAGSRAVDGYLLYAALVGPYFSQLNAVITQPGAFRALVNSLPLYEQLLASPFFTTVDAGVDLTNADRVAALNALSRQFVLALYRTYYQGVATSGWSVPDLAYAFSLVTQAGPKGAVRLTAREHRGGDLSWYSLDQEAAPVGTGSPAAPVTRRFMPTEIQFPGAPNARWWEFEDRRVDFGAMTGDPSDFGRMLFQEFMLLYQNDWFSLPCEVPVGTLCTINGLKVTDVFGTSYQLQPAGAGTMPEAEDGLLPDGVSPRIDDDAGRWRLFSQTNKKEEPTELFVPPTAVAPLVGRPVEQVSFRREEATNLVWAVEQTIANGFARGMDGHGAAAQVAEYVRAGPAASALPSPASYRYELASPVSENWIPFVPSLDETGTTYLEQGALARHTPGLAPADATVQPRTSLLQLLPDASYRVHEHEIPPAGLRVDSAFRRARWFNGRTVLWYGRSLGAASAAGSSGLVFDRLVATSGAN